MTYDRFIFHSRSELHGTAFAHVIQPLPDAFISIESDKAYARTRHKQYFLEVFDEIMPFFVIVRRLKKWVEYAENKEWTSSKLPPILIVCESKSLQRSVPKQLRRKLRAAYTHMVFYTICIDTLERWEHPDEELWLKSTYIEEEALVSSLA